MIISSGYGFFVAIICVGVMVIAQLVTNIIAGNEEYWSAHRWPQVVGVWASAAACFFLGKILRKRHVEIPLFSFEDEESEGDTIRLVQNVRESHTFFFIPVIWWGPILFVIGIIVMFKK